MLHKGSSKVFLSSILLFNYEKFAFDKQVYEVAECAQSRYAMYTTA